MAASSVKRVARAFVPPPLLRHWDTRRQEARRARAVLQLLAGDAYPWTSPNIWDLIVEFYRNLERPALLEFGMGASTLWHARELSQLAGARYTGVESSPDWFWSVVAAVLRNFHELIHRVRVRGAGGALTTGVSPNVEIELGSLTLDLRLRLELPEYLDALASPHDVVIVDGISRKSCVQALLAEPPFRRRGLLMLMEAGRGRPEWWEGRLVGQNDYQPEVGLLLERGAELLHGNGLDSWPGCGRRSPKPVSDYYPLEACRLLFAGHD